MKALFFDAGPVITLVMSRMVDLLPKLKEKYGGKFYITEDVRYELVDRPLTMKRFQFEALQVLRLIREGTFEIYTDIDKNEIEKLKEQANSAFHLGRKTMDVLQAGELSSVVAAKQCGADGIVIDERTLRLYLEAGDQMESLLERRFKKNVTVDSTKMKAFASQFSDVKIVRSIELVGSAYKHGLLDCYLPEGNDPHSALLDAVLWATKYNGCAVTNHEIEEIKEMLLRK